MPVEVELVHAEPGRRVVLARLSEAGGISATALGEGSDAEEAEDRARARLGAARPQPVPPSVTLPAPTAATPPSEQPSPAAKPTVQPSFELSSPAQAATNKAADAAEPASPEPAPDPEDWSSELANLDLQLKRLGWGRDQEAIYLLRAFGHGSRSRLTTYGDLLAYLRALEGFAPGADPAACAIPLKRSDLLSQSDALLAQLGWDAARGRELLESRFSCNSRQHLSDSQLLAFNMELESALMASAAINSGAPAG